MKTIFTAIALIAAVFGAQLLAATIFDGATETYNTAQTTGSCEPFSGMFFSTENVIEEYEYDDAYCLLYHDPDAGIEDAEICVDLETYQMVRAANDLSIRLVGSLVLNDDYSYSGVRIYTYMPEPEMELAAASTKSCVIKIEKLTQE